MRERASISGISPETVGQALFDELRRINPDGYGVGRPSWHPPHKPAEWLDVRLGKDDPRVEAILGVLAQRGFTPWLGFRKMAPKQFQLMILREFDESDLAACEFLQPDFGHAADAADRDEAGRIKVNATTLPRKGGLAWCHRGHLVSEAVRRGLVAAGLQRLRFLPTSIGDHSSVDEGENEVVEYDGRTWWELTTDVVLPPILLSGGLALLDCDGQPVRHGDFTNGCFLREGAVQNPELRYRASDLAALAPFDIAKTFEIFGNRPYAGRPPNDDNRLTVVSQRFYQACRSINENVHGSPVRIVEE